MKKALLHPLFLISLFLYALKWTLPHLGIEIALVQNYLADLVCLPIVLSLALGFMRLVKRAPDYRLNGLQVGFALIYFSVFFEWFLPLRSDTYTGDLFDVLAYFLGVLIFYFGINPKLSHLPEKPAPSAS